MSSLNIAERDRILELLNEQKTLVDGFLRLTDEQSRHLAEDNIDKFLVSINARQSIIEQIDSLVLEINRLMGDRSDESFLADDAIMSLRREIRDCLLEIQRKNTENETAAQVLKSELAGEIRKLSQNQKGLGGYARNASANMSEYFDKKF